MAYLSGLFRLGRDAEVRSVNGDSVANLSLAYNYGRKEGDSRPTQWVEAALWGKRAESLAPYLKKGSQIDAILTDVHVQEYDKKDGTKGVKLSARILELEFAGGRSESSESVPKMEEPKREAKKPKADDFPDDDIPF